jgi:Xaa-Pro aminopeptidase
MGFESARLAVANFGTLRDKGPRIDWLPTEGLVEKLRMVKSPGEVEAIRRSVRINSEAFDRAVEHLRPGLSENFFAAEIDFQQRAAGAEGSSFDTIVASGPRSALVHARPSGDPILPNELLLIDMGAQCGGYASDMTRMAFPGTPGRLVRSRYKAVLEAQHAAIDAVREGIDSRAVDRAARGVLDKHGFKDNFAHSTGHGLGLEIHEPPRVARRWGTVLEAGMAITIEPGIYIAGFGGIRIEDTVLVTARGCEVLTPTSKDLLTV